MGHRMGIIGFGWMGSKHFLSIIPKNCEMEVAAAYDTDPERLELAEQLGIQPYDRLEEFFARGDIDVILVSTPNYLHKSYALEALRAGKHVICEKPAVLHAEELLEIMKAAERADRIFTVHQNRRWDPDYLLVKEAIRRNMIGAPVIIESRVQGANGIPGDWRREKKYGGGMLYDWGVHLIDQLLYLINSEVVSVYAQLLQVNYNVDDNIRLILKFKNGILAQIDVTTICFQQLPRWNVLGSDGTLQVMNWECEGKVIKGKVQEVDWSIEKVKNAAGFTRTMRPRPEDSVELLPLPELSQEDKQNTFYENFIKAVEGDTRFYVKAEEILRTCRVIDACFESAKKGTVISCEI